MRSALENIELFSKIYPLQLFALGQENEEVLQQLKIIGWYSHLYDVAHNEIFQALKESFTMNEHDWLAMSKLYETLESENITTYEHFETALRKLELNPEIVEQIIFIADALEKNIQALKDFSFTFLPLPKMIGCRSGVNEKEREVLLDKITACFLLERLVSLLEDFYDKCHLRLTEVKAILSRRSADFSSFFVELLAALKAGSEKERPNKKAMIEKIQSLKESLSQKDIELCESDFKCFYQLLSIELADEIYTKVFSFARLTQYKQEFSKRFEDFIFYLEREGLVDRLLLAEQVRSYLQTNEVSFSGKELEAVLDSFDHFVDENPEMGGAETNKARFFQPHSEENLLHLEMQKVRWILRDYYNYVKSSLLNFGFGNEKALDSLMGKFLQLAELPAPKACEEMQGFDCSRFQELVANLKLLQENPEIKQLPSASSSREP